MTFSMLFNIWIIKFYSSKKMIFTQLLKKKMIDEFLISRKSDRWVFFFGRLRSWKKILWLKVLAIMIAKSLIQRIFFHEHKQAKKKNSSIMIDEFFFFFFRKTSSIKNMILTSVSYFGIKRGYQKCFLIFFQLKIYTTTFDW